MRKTLLFLGLLVLSSTVAATSIAEENVTVDLQDYNVEKEIRFTELTSNRMTYITNHPVNNLEVQIEGEPTQCNYEDTGLGAEISCQTDYYENFTATINYNTAGLITPRESASIFRYSQNIYRPTDQYNFKVILPEGTGLLDQENVSTPVIEPDFGEVGSEGRRIHVEWSQDPELGETISFQAVYENLNTDFRNIILLIVAMILAAGSIRYFKNYRSSSQATSVIDSLSEDQREVVELLKQEESMLQKDIVDSSKYSKAKISGLVSELEDLDLIEKEKEGRSNRIKLKDEYL